MYRRGEKKVLNIDIFSMVANRGWQANVVVRETAHLRRNDLDNRSRAQ
jgi:hypothetical protein